MGVNRPETHSTLIHEDLKKRDANSLKIGKKNLLFIAFAVIVLQVADTVMIWLMGSSQSSTSQFSGDSFMFTAAVFGICKGIYDKFFSNKAKVGVQEASIADEVEEEALSEDEYHQSATVVVDTMKYKTWTHTKKSKQAEVSKYGGSEAIQSKLDYSPINEAAGSEATIWLSSWLRAPSLNPKAKKFMPNCSHWMSTLDSGASVFVPQAHVKKEEQMLKSEFGDEDAGSVVYRSNRWLNEIGSQEKIQQKQNKQNKQDKPMLSPAKDTSKNSKFPVYYIPEPPKLQKAAWARKWQPKVK